MIYNQEIPKHFIEKSNNAIESDFEIGEPRTYNRASKTDISLGKSFNPLNPADLKTPDLFNFEQYRIDSGNAGAKFELIYINKYRSFEEILKIDSSISASYLGNSADASLKETREVINKEDSINILIKAYVDYGRWGIKNVRLSDKANTLLETDQQEFIKRYGTRYVQMESRMNSIFIQISILKASKYTRKHLESLIKIQGGYGEFSGKAQQKITREIKTHNNTNNVMIKAFSLGGNGIGEYAKLAIGVLNNKNEKDPLSNIAGKLTTILNGFNADNALSYSYSVASLRNFGLKEKAEIPWSHKRIKALKEFKDLYVDSVSKLDILSQIKDGSHFMNAIYPPGIFDSMVANYDLYASFIDDIRTKHHNCLNNPNEDSFRPFNFIYSIIWPDFLVGLNNSPRIETYGYYRPVGSPNTAPIKSIDHDILSELLSKHGESRKSTMLNYFPDSDGEFGSTFQPSGIGIQTYKLYGELKGKCIHYRSRDIIPFGHTINHYTGNPSYSSFIRDFEPWLINEVITDKRYRPVVIIGTNVDYEYTLYGELIDKAGRTFKSTICTISLTAQFHERRKKIFNIKTNYRINKSIYDE